MSAERKLEGDPGFGFNRRRFIAGAATGAAALSMFSQWPRRAAASAGGASILPGLSGDFAAAARDPAQFRAVFGSAVEIGAQVVRFPLDWAQVERSPGAYDWSGHDALHGELLWNGLKALPAVINAPDWLAGDCAVTPGGLRYPTSDRGLNALADFAVVAARYFSRFRACIHGLEVWPRPNFGPSALAKPEEFAVMVDAVALEAGSALRVGEQVFEPLRVIAGAVRSGEATSLDFLGVLQENAVVPAAGVELPAYSSAEALEQTAEEALAELRAAGLSDIWLHAAPPDAGARSQEEAASLKRVAQGQLQLVPEAVTFSSLAAPTSGESVQSAVMSGAEGGALTTASGQPTAAYDLLMEAWNGE